MKQEKITIPYEKCIGRYRLNGELNLPHLSAKSQMRNVVEGKYTNLWGRSIKLVDFRFNEGNKCFEGTFDININDIARV